MRPIRLIRVGAGHQKIHFQILASLELKREKEKEQMVKEQRAKRNLVQAESNTETEAVATAARIVPATKSRAAKQRIIAPRTTTKHTELAFF